MNWIRAHLRILCLTLAGSILGALSGLALGHAMLLRATNASLLTYASELLNNADTLANEIDSIFLQVRAPGAPICSDQDLEALKARTFGSGHVKDIGRTHDGILYCSGFLGRLKYPYSEGPTSIAMTEGLNVYTNAAVLIASKGDGRGTIVEAGDSDIVLNSDAFGIWNRPHQTYMVVALNRDTGRMITIAGVTLDIDLPSVLAQRSQIIRGTLFRPVCSAAFSICVVTAEPLTDVWASTRATQFAYAAMGGFAGLSLGLLLFVFHKRTTTLTWQLQRAIRKDSPALSLVYQPIIDVRTGRCTGAEALLRWKNHSGASIPPDIFIPLAEENGFIHQLTALVIRRATRELAPLLRTSHDFTLSLNIAASDLGDEQLFQLLGDHVLLPGLHPTQIALELTERSTADLALVGPAIQRLRAQGYKVHIDDFGVGFSSLSYLDQLQVNAIKIDRTFTRTIGTDAVIAPMLSQMLDMARTLGVEVIVEGVETEFQRDYLAASGMPLRSQGWYFSRPLTASALLLFDTQNQALHESASTRLQQSPQETSASLDPETALLSTT